MNYGYKKYHEATLVGQSFNWTVGGTPGPLVFSQLDTYQPCRYLSESHRFYKGRWDGGGPFITAKITRHMSGDRAIVYRPGWGLAYIGMFTVPTPGETGPNMGAAYINDRYNQLSYQGATAWSRLRPDKPDFTVALSLAELKDPLGTLKEAVSRIRKRIHKVNAGRKRSGRSELSRAGQYYLAIQFGWAPLLNDVRNYMKAQQGLQKRLRQLIRDNGRPVRRRVNLSASNSMTTDNTSTYNSGSGAAVNPGFVTQCYGPGPTARHETSQHLKQTWAEGVFRYHLPPGPRDVVWTKKMERRIMGHRVTPDVVYNLIPWSWLADYFTNLGDFISNVSAGVGDRLAADYCYIMEHSKDIKTREASVHVQSSMVANAKLTMVYAESSTTSESKFRMEASPFGFGFKASSLTPKQYAILGALGLSRLP